MYKKGYVKIQEYNVDDFFITQLKNNLKNNLKNIGNNIDKEFNMSVNEDFLEFFYNDNANKIDIKNKISEYILNEIKKLHLQKEGSYQISMKIIFENYEDTIFYSFKIVKENENYYTNYFNQ